MPPTWSDGDDLEGLFREHAEGYTPTPDEGTWKAIRRKRRHARRGERRRFLARSGVMVVVFLLLSAFLRQWQPPYAPWASYQRPSGSHRHPHSASEGAPASSSPDQPRLPGFALSPQAGERSATNSPLPESSSQDAPFSGASRRLGPMDSASAPDAPLRGPLAMLAPEGSPAPTEGRAGRASRRSLPATSREAPGRGASRSKSGLALSNKPGAQRAPSSAGGSATEPKLVQSQRPSRRRDGIAGHGGTEKAQAGRTPQLDTAKRARNSLQGRLGSAKQTVASLESSGSSSASLSKTASTKQALAPLPLVSFAHRRATDTLASPEQLDTLPVLADHRGLEQKRLLPPEPPNKPWSAYFHAGAGDIHPETQLASEYVVPTADGKKVISPDASYADYQQGFTPFELQYYGVDLGYQLGRSGLRLQSGFSYRHLSREIWYYHNQSPRNDDLVLLDYRSHQNHGYQAQRVYTTNSYTFLQLPMGLSYTLGEHTEGFQMQMSAGGAVRHLVEADAMAYHFYFQEFEHHSERAGEIFREWQWSLHGALHLRYQLGNQIAIQVGGRYQHSLESLYSDNYPVSQKLHPCSFDLGIRRRF